MYGIKTLGKNLRESYGGLVRTHGPGKGNATFRKMLSRLRKEKGGKDEGKFDSHLSIRALAEGILGENWQHRLTAGYHSLQHGGLLMESEVAIDASAFSNITGQLLIDRIRENYEDPEYIGDKLMELIPANGNLGLHREPWMSRVKEGPSVIQPNMPYPHATFVEQFIDLVPPAKRGEICSLTLEMVASDKTKMALDSADDIGRKTRFDREERQLKVIAGFVNNFRYMATTYNTFLTTGLWVNKVTSNQITDYRGLTQLEYLFTNMTDLVTGKAIRVDKSKMQILATPIKVPEIKIALNGARTRSGPFPTSGATSTQVEYNGVPLISENSYPYMTSEILWHLLTDAASAGGQALTVTQAKEYVWIGNFKRAFYYREQEPFSTVQAPPGNPAEFHQDIVVQVKVREWGEAGVQRPQEIALSVNT